MEKNKIIAFSLLGAGLLIGTIGTAYAFLRKRKVSFESGNDDDVVYVLLDDSRK